MTKKTDIFVAIDTHSMKNAKKLIGQLNNKHCGIKIGKELFTSCGPEIVQWVKSEGFEIIDREKVGAAFVLIHFLLSLQLFQHPHSLIQARIVS